MKIMTVLLCSLALLAASAQAGVSRTTGDYHKSVGEATQGKSALIAVSHLRSVQGATTMAAELKDYQFFEAFTVDTSQNNKEAGSILLAVPKDKVEALIKRVGTATDSTYYYGRAARITKLRGPLQKVVLEIPGDMVTYRWTDLGVFDSSTRQLTGFCVILPATP